jgi:hypothetical protein
MITGTGDKEVVGVADEAGVRIAERKVVEGRGWIGEKSES